MLVLKWDEDDYDYHYGTKAELYQGETLVWKGHGPVGRILRAAGVMFEEYREHRDPDYCWHILEEDENL